MDLSRALLVALTVALLAAAGCIERRPGTPLGNAARGGDVAGIDRLIADGADVNEPSYLPGWPPVIHAIHHGHRDALVRLIEHGASLEGAIGERALFMASGSGNAAIVDVLLATGVPLPTDPPTATSLLAVTMGGTWDYSAEWSGCERHTEAARLLVDRGQGLRFAGALSPTSVARVASTLEYGVAHVYARFQDCEELLQVVSPEGRAGRDAARIEAQSTELLPGG